MITIDPTRLAKIDEIYLRSGVGKGANGTIDVCAMQLVDWLAGGDGLTDSPDCVDRVITSFVIRLNDAPRFAPWRDELKPYLPRLLNTRVDVATTRTRAYLCADWAVRYLTPKAFDFWAEMIPKRADLATEWAKKLRAVEPIVDEASARAAQRVAREAASAADAADAAYAASAASAAYAADAASAASAAYAADAAYAASAAYAAYAADAAYAASAAYAADAADAAYAASAAYAADARSKADAFSRECWDDSLALLDRLIRVTEIGIESVA